MRAFETNSKLDDIPGIVFKRDGQLIRTKEEERIKNLDAIPFPAHDLFPVDIYLKRSPIYGYTGARHMPILASRGCPYPCTYCDRAFGKATYYRSVESIMEEISWLKKDFGVQVVSFIDDYFFPNKERIFEISDAFRTHHPDIKWHCLGRVDKVDPEQLRAMAKAGCVSIGYGIESGSDTMLKEMKKHITAEQARNAMRWAAEAGITPRPSFLVGMPGESEQTIRESTAFRKEINRYIPQANENTFWVAPLPGTELYAYCKRVKAITDDLDYITRYSDVHTIWKFFMNLTKLPDDVIKRLKAESQNEIFWDYYRKHPGQLIARYVRAKVLRYTGLELAGRAVRKFFRLRRKADFLQRGLESPHWWQRRSWRDRVLGRVDAVLGGDGNPSQAH
jgi:anaerobic magnesium-protoporphyrin IX monomethyl ester cyclase